MRKITSITPTNDFQLHVKFNDGVEKQVDFKPYLQYPVFSTLKNLSLFKQVVNREYFIEWQGQEIDLSADILWHDGKTTV